MRNSKKGFFKLGFVFLLVILVIPLVNTENKETATKSGDISSPNASYTLVNPINISSSSDWILYPFITGTGSEIDPYIIEEVTIRGSGVHTIPVDWNDWDTIIDPDYFGILIDADDNFTIRNCEIFDFSIGIKLGPSSKNGTISNVEIDSCGTGVQGGGLGESLKSILIRNCHITNCVSISKLDTYYYFGQQNQYGGFGIWAYFDRLYNNFSIIEGCTIEDCTYGIYIDREVNVTNNDLIGCTIVMNRITMIWVADYIHDDNTINGKPLGIFRGEVDPLTSAQANEYGYLYFLGCVNISLSGIKTPLCILSGTNISLSDIKIKDRVGIGLYIFHMGTPSLPHGPNLNLNDITIENQDIGYYCMRNYYKADNLVTENCEIGFVFHDVIDSVFTKLQTSSALDDFIAIDRIYNSTLEIEIDSSFHFFDTGNATDGFHIESSSGSYNILKLPYPEPYSFEFSEEDLYHIKNRVLIGGPMEFEYIDFYIQVARKSIPGYSMLIFLTISMISIVILFRKITKTKKLETS